MARFADRLREGQWLAISYILMGLAAMVYSLSATIAMAIFVQGVNSL